MLIEFEEIPEELYSMLGDINEITFPRQGHTSDVGIIKTNRRSFVLKRAKGSRFCSWLTKEFKILKILSETKIPIRRVYNFIDQHTMQQSWLLMEFLEGDTLRSYLLKETDKEKRNKVIFNFGKALAQIHSSSCQRCIHGYSLA